MPDRAVPDAMAWRDHLVDDVLGWWMTHGPDPEYGGVLTCWDNAGTTLVSTTSTPGRRAAGPG